MNSQCTIHISHKNRNARSFGIFSCVNNNSRRWKFLRVFSRHNHSKNLRKICASQNPCMGHEITIRIFITNSCCKCVWTFFIISPIFDTPRFRFSTIIAILLATLKPQIGNSEQLPSILTKLAQLRLKSSKYGIATLSLVSVNLDSNGRLNQNIEMLIKWCVLLCTLLNGEYKCI